MIFVCSSISIALMCKEIKLHHQQQHVVGVLFCTFYILRLFLCLVCFFIMLILTYVLLYMYEIIIYMLMLYKNLCVVVVVVVCELI